MKNLNDLDISQGPECAYEAKAMDYSFLLKIWVKILVKNISKSLSSKYSPGMLAMHHNHLDHAKQSASDALKTASK